MSSTDVGETSRPVADWLAVAARERPAHPFIEQDSSGWTYSWCDGRVSAIAGALHALGVHGGTRVAVWGGNDLDTALALFAIPRAGATVVPINTRLHPDEIERQLGEADVSLVLRSKHAPPFELEGTSALDIDSLAGMPLAVAWHDGEDDFAAVFTSGTSGPGKGVRLSWRALEASAAASAEHLDHGPNDRWLAVLPFFHVGGLSILIRSARQASTVVLGSAFEGFPIERSLGTCTLASLIPTQLVRLIDDTEGFDLPRLKAILLGGGPVPPGLVERAAEKGLPVLVTYGQTEAASQIATAPLESPGTRRARPLGGMEVRIVDDSGIELPPGVVGTIEVRGDELFSGYLGDAHRHPEDWHPTGDLGDLDDDGLLAVRARADRLIITGGENVHPREIEDALIDGGASEACVVGVPDTEWGRVVAAAVVSHVSTDQLEFFLRERLAGFKVPRRWLVVDELPRNDLGKIQAKKVERLFGE